jgi:hypothetical protein
MLTFNTIFRIAQAQAEESSPPLVGQGGEDIIYIGIALMVVVIILAVGVINRRIEKAIIFAALVSAAMMAVIFFL